MILEGISKGTFNPKSLQCDSDGVSLSRTPIQLTKLFVTSGTLTPTSGKKIKVIAYNYTIIGTAQAIQSIDVIYDTTTNVILHINYPNVAAGIPSSSSLSGLNLEGAINEDIVATFGNVTGSVTLYYEEL